jgi:hypothetical protein
MQQERFNGTHCFHAAKLNPHQPKFSVVSVWWRHGSPPSPTPRRRRRGSPVGSLPHLVFRGVAEAEVFMPSYPNEINVLDVAPPCLRRAWGVSLEVIDFVASSKAPTLPHFPRRGMRWGKCQGQGWGRWWSRNFGGAVSSLSRERVKTLVFIRAIKPAGRRRDRRGSPPRIRGPHTDARPCACLSDRSRFMCYKGYSASVALHVTATYATSPKLS